MRRIFPIIPLLVLAIGAPASAQGLGGLGGALDRGLGGVGDVLGGVIDPVTRTVGDIGDGLGETVAQVADRLQRARIDRIDDLVRRNRDTIALDRMGNPARRGELLVMDAAPAEVAAAGAAGFAVLEESTVEGLGLSVLRLSVPEGMDLDDAQDALAALIPTASVSADVLHFRSGSAEVAQLALAGSRAARINTPVGMIDGAPGKGVSLVAQHGFAKGAPVPSDHGSAVGSLLNHAGVSNLRVADVYGTDPAGGNALAIAKGLGWLVEGGSKVVTISLVGPESPLVSRAIAAAQKRGTVVVAAVGNDGPASPPAYPASYRNVVAVTGVDRHDRALIEAGRALHLDYAAPGADIKGRDRKGRRRDLRGTSYATPLVAARIAAALTGGGNWRGRLDGEAKDLGDKGADDTYGRGLICGSCVKR
ncbi:S8 family serine peptidase [Croceicoccus gelatinilyticus]|uniref:S8 family serine peptidase n=1 Tax=Croceicoccus gelatinilyticus TaxID=2835536 RepID=UPI001BD17F62|nr:S8 family serine peptidase [Croceicoccus gelatinilyticus]MBS7670155.1 S8 family serine peptidase [Croceicoccus gelatinilyticus]